MDINYYSSDGQQIEIIFHDYSYGECVVFVCRHHHWNLQ